MGLLRTAVYVAIIGIVYKQAVKFFTKKPPQAGAGFAAPGWRNVADVFRKSIDDEQEKGGILTVYHKGELVVEFWGGYAHREANVKWTKDTLGLYCSVAKIAGATCIAKLVDRGLVSYESRVAEYWPEFGQNGKEKITVEQLLSHQAGLAIIDEKFSIYDVKNDPEKVGRILAAQKPNWEPGSHHGYHGITMGLYMDQLLRRVDPQHRSLSQFFQDEIAEPFDIDFYIGLPKSENYRTAFVEPLDLLSLETLLARGYWNVMYSHMAEPNSYFSRSLINPPEVLDDDNVNHPDFREVPSPSGLGFGTGASMAKLLGLLTSGRGEYNGQQLISPAAVKRLSQVAVTGRDIILQRNITYGPGSMIRTGPHGGPIFGHVGSGGQIAFGDLENQLAWSYVTTYHSVYALGDSPKTLKLESVIYECLDQFKKSN